MTILPPPRRAQTTGERYVAELALGRDPREGIHVYTDGPVPETGTVNIFTVEYRFGRARPALIEPFPADHLARWRGYSLDMQTFPPIDRERPRKPTWDVFEDDGTPLYTLEIFRTRVRAHDDRLFAELLTLPGDRPRPGIFGWQATIPPGDEIQRAVHGLELLGLELEAVQDLDAARSRRRPRLEELEDATDEQGWLTLTERAIELHRKHGVEWKIAADRIGVSSKTLKRWRARRTKLLNR